MANSFKKAGVLASATALAASVVFVGTSVVANAAPVTVDIAADFVAPGGTTTVTVAGCSVGAELALLVGSTETVVTVTDATLPVTETITYESQEPGTELLVTATCTPPAGSVETETSASDSVYFFSTGWIEAIPADFFAGEPVTIVAGDFVPGSTVSLEVYPLNGEELIFSADLGVAADDFSVSGEVTFPADLACGTYDLDIFGGDHFVAAELYICEDEEPTPSPTPTATATPTVAPGPSASPSATVSPSATATASPTRTTVPRPNPGLPDTGN